MVADARPGEDPTLWLAFKWEVIISSVPASVVKPLGLEIAGKHQLRLVRLSPSQQPAGGCSSPRADTHVM